MTILEKLYLLQDLEYKKFHARLMPTIDENKIIGIRVPKLRDYAKEIFGTELANIFVKDLPHDFYEEDNLHAFLIERIADFNECVEEIERFLPYVNNWATCDMLRPKAFKKNPKKLFPYVKSWITKKETYTIRFAIGMLLSFYLDEHFNKSHIDLVLSVKSDEYYVNMMRAWYFATALSKHWELCISVIEDNLLDEWTHNKTIQKAIESYRITKEQKEHLRKLKIKG